MKLLSRITISFSLVSLMVFVIGGVCFYLVAMQQIQKETKMKLVANIRGVQDFVARENGIPDSSYETVIRPVGSFAHATPIFSDTDIYDSGEKEIIPYGWAIQDIVVQGSNYRISTRESRVESEDLVLSIVASLLGIFGLLLAALIGINRWVAREIWRPFFETVETLKSFNPGAPGTMNLQATSILEFSELNRVAENMADRIHKDYASLREFTEDASHEIQTPLAVLSAKLELLLESNRIPGEEIRLVHSARQSVARLSRLNRGLLLLAKLEGGDFQNQANIDWGMVVGQECESFCEILEMRKIRLRKKNTGNGPKVPMNPALAEILVSNILRNAVEHNQEGGRILVLLGRTSLIVANTGAPPVGDPEKMFARFQKSRPGSNSVGLGLSIVKKICEIKGFGIRYTYRRNLHIISIVLDSKHS